MKPFEKEALDICKAAPWLAEEVRKALLAAHRQGWDERGEADAGRHDKEANYCLRSTDPAVGEDLQRSAVQQGLGPLTPGQALNNPGLSVMRGLWHEANATHIRAIPYKEPKP